MLNLYEKKSYNSAKNDAQANLEGRTHYVDNDTLRFHYSRILESRAHDNGLLFSIITSDALDMHNTKRGFRYVIFDLFGNVVDRPGLENTFKTSLKARKAMYEALNGVNAYDINMKGLEQWEKNNGREKEYIIERMNRAKERSQS